VGAKEDGLKRRMSDKHEAHLADRLRGRQTRGSGNQSANPMDGRHSRMDQSVAFAWDGKSTLGKSISITDDMWNKAVEQAHGERPMLAFRWYATDRLEVKRDLICVSLDDFEELQELAARADK
jgi:hypothetical protein